MTNIATESGLADSATILRSAQGDFNLWSSAIRATASGKSSLDWRLRHYAKETDVVCELISGLTVALKTCKARVAPTARSGNADATREETQSLSSIESSASWDAMSAEWSGSESNHTNERRGSEEHGHERKLDAVISENLSYVTSILDQLARKRDLVSLAIRKAGNKYRFEKADAALKEEEFEDYRKHLTRIILRAFPDPDAERLNSEEKMRRASDFERLTSVQKRLVHGNVLRKHRIQWVSKSRKKKVRPELNDHNPRPMTSAAHMPLSRPPSVAVSSNHGNPVPSISISRAPPQAATDTPVPPSIVQTDAPTATEVGPHLDIRRFMAGETASKITNLTRIGNSQSYPRCPRPVGDKSLICPYCDDLLPPSYAKKEQSWKAHVVQDLMPYICFIDDCKTPFEMYLTAESLVAHMIEEHSCVRWTCDYCKGETKPSDATNDSRTQEFTSEVEWQKHMAQYHSKLMPAEKRSLLVDLNKRSMIGPLVCPLCDTFKKEVLDTRIDDHILQHLHEFALWALPEGAEGQDDDRSKASQITGSLSHTKTVIGDVRPSSHGYNMSDASAVYKLDPVMSDMHGWEDLKAALLGSLHERSLQLYIPRLQKILATLEWPVDLDSDPQNTEALNDARSELEDAMKEMSDFPQSLGLVPVPIVANAPPFSPHFVSRDDLLEDLEDRLFHHSGSLLHFGNIGQPKQQARVILTGKSGVGKTALAAHWWHKIKDNDISTFWINASTEHEIEGSFQTCWSEVGSPLGPTHDSVHALLYYLNWVHKTPWLMVFDNVVPHTAQFLRFRGWIPSGLLGCILFTTSHSSGHSLLGPATTIQVPQLEKVELLNQSTILSRPSSLEAFRIAILCTSPGQLKALEISLDEKWDVGPRGNIDLPSNLDGLTNAYVVGRMSRHNVVLVFMHALSGGAGNQAATEVVATFPSVQLAFVVGTCGGVPETRDIEYGEVLLGDVILSKTLVPYETGKVDFDMDPINTLEERQLRAEHRALWSLLQFEVGLQLVRRRTNVFLNELQSNANQSRFYNYPGPHNDMLFESAYSHGGVSTATDTTDRRARPCEEICNEMNLVRRKRLEQLLDVEMQKGESVQDPMLHVGRVALLDDRVRVGALRDNIARETGAVAMTLERTALSLTIPSVLVQSISNYADGHLTELFHSFAVATAASATKALLEVVVSNQEEAASKDEDSIIPTLPQPPFEALQSRLAEIVKVCNRQQGTHPKFSEVREDVSGIAFQLRMWGRIVEWNSMGTNDSTERDALELTTRTLQRLLDRASDLCQALNEAEPDQLDADAMAPTFDGGSNVRPSEDDDDDSEFVPETPGFLIQAHLDSLQLQMRTLGQLTRTLQEAAPSAKEDMNSLEALVDEVNRWFGTLEAVDSLPPEMRFAGRKALDEARLSQPS